MGLRQAESILGIFCLWNMHNLASASPIWLGEVKSGQSQVAVVSKSGLKESQVAAVRHCGHGELAQGPPSIAIFCPAVLQFMQASYSGLAPQILLVLDCSKTCRTRGRNLQSWQSRCKACIECCGLVGLLLVPGRTQSPRHLRYKVPNGAT